ncbi:hypothetical protein ACXZ9C_11330 [Streptococcus agalactiae]
MALVGKSCGSRRVSRVVVVVALVFERGISRVVVSRVAWSVVVGRRRGGRWLSDSSSAYRRVVLAW